MGVIQLAKHTVPSLRDTVSPEEWQTRVDLAACYRLADHFNWTHMVFSHFSARVPGEDGHFLLLPQGLVFNEITASNLLKVNLKGEIVSKSPYTLAKPAFVIHSAIYHAPRKDIQAAIHTHTIAGMALSALECGLLPLTQGAIKLCHKTGYHDYEGHAVELEERERIARNLGNGNMALILRNHGLLTVGRTISEAFYYMFHLEKSASAQLAAMACNTPLRIPPKSVVDHAAEQSETMGLTGNRGDEIWPGMVRMIEEKDPSFRD